MRNFFVLLLLQAAPLFTNEPLRVGMELSYPPFEMICTDGKPCGVSVDLVHAFGKYVNRPIHIENISFIGLVPSLKNGNIDMIVSSLTITEQRKKVVDFSDPYAATGLSLLINIHSKVNNIEDANQEGAVIVVKSGTSGELYALNNLKNATIRVLEKEAMCVLEVVQGKADAFIYDQLSVYTNWKKNEETTKANLKPFHEEQWAFAVRKNNQELLKEINAFLKKFKEKGGFDALADKYLPVQKKAFKEMGVPFVF